MLMALFPSLSIFVHIYTFMNICMCLAEHVYVGVRVCVWRPEGDIENLPLRLCTCSLKRGLSVEPKVP